MDSQGWKDSEQAFNDAIAAGRLSADRKAVNYAGHYMYMGPGRDKATGASADAFKHIVTRQYI